MTAIGTRPSTGDTAERDALLRFALRADATLTALAGLIIAVAAGAPPMTGFGATLTLATAACTALFAWLQYLGVRRLAA